MGDLEYKTYTFKSGAVYEGTFKDTKRHGKGHWRHPEGEVYEGEYSENRQHGFGTYVFPNGKRYVGSWVAGEMSGEGVYYFSSQNNTYYAGGYIRDKKHGVGFYLYDNGLMTVQRWNEGTMESELDATPCDRIECARMVASITVSARKVAPKELGLYPEVSAPKTFQFPSGSTYTGEYVQTKKVGKGHWTHPDGDSYSGQFEENTHNGWGVYVTGRSGKKYAGQWRDGKMSGWGVYFFKADEAEYFVGQYQDDKRHGIGMYHFAESGNNKAQSYEQGVLKKEVDADEKTSAQYTAAVRSILTIMHEFAPQYKSVGFP